MADKYALSVARLLLCKSVAFAVLVAMGLFGTSVSAQEEVTLRAISYLPEGNRLMWPFEEFLRRVNSEGKGAIKINFLGGAPKVMNIFEVGNATSTGAVDLAYTAPAFYTTQLPLGNALYYAELTIQEQRKNGAWEFINKLHNEQMNVWYLSRPGDRIRFSYYTNVKMSKPADFKGIRMRSSTLHTPFLRSLGAQTVETSIADMYPALERGVVQGFGYTDQGIMDLQLHEVVKYRIDPSFYRLANTIMVNLDVWKNKLNDRHRALLTKIAIAVEDMGDRDIAIFEEEKKQMAARGVQTITFTGRDAEEYLRTAQDSGWAAVIKRDPVNGPKLRALITK